MTEPLYDAYLTGQLLSGTEPADAARRLARLFKRPPETMRGLLTGKPQLLKRGLTRAAALKYREALRSAGVAVAFRPQQEKPAPASAAETATAPLTLAAAQTPLLRPEERRAQPEREVDVAGLTLAPLTPLPPSPSEPAPPLAVDHFSLAPAGSDVLSDEERQPEVASLVKPGDWSVAAPGSQLAPATAPPAAPPVATDHLQALLPDGELLAPEERQPAPPPYQLSEASDWRLEE